MAYSTEQLRELEKLFTQAGYLPLTDKTTRLLDEYEGAQKAARSARPPSAADLRRELQERGYLSQSKGKQLFDELRRLRPF